MEKEPERNLGTAHPENTHGRTPKTRHRKLPIILASVIGTLLVLAASFGGWKFLHRVVSPVPKAIQANVTFPVYYPEQKKLPAGYTLDLTSFKSPEKNAVVYAVRYGTNKKLVFALQEKPSDDDIQSFYANYIPLRNKLDVPAGHAEIGAFNNGGKTATQSVVSLPTTNKTWLIITGPNDIDQNNLKQVLESIRK